MRDGGAFLGSAPRVDDRHGELHRLAHLGSAGSECEGGPRRVQTVIPYRKLVGIVVPYRESGEAANGVKNHTSLNPCLRSPVAHPLRLAAHRGGGRDQVGDALVQERRDRAAQRDDMRAQLAAVLVLPGLRQHPRAPRSAYPMASRQPHAPCDVRAMLGSSVKMAKCAFRDIQYKQCIVAHHREYHTAQWPLRLLALRACSCPGLRVDISTQGRRPTIPCVDMASLVGAPSRHAPSAPLSLSLCMLLLAVPVLRLPLSLPLCVCSVIVLPPLSSVPLLPLATLVAVSLFLYSASTVHGGLCGSVASSALLYHQCYAWWPKYPGNPPIANPI